MPCSPETDAYLSSLERFGMRLGLERIAALVEGLGNPQRRFPAIHIVGTNGKSTTAFACEALLRAEGLRTGTFWSPRLTGFAEQVRVDAEEVSLDSPIARLRALPMAESPTQFEAMTAAALLAFAEAAVEAAVVEAGLGGRYDATNVLGARVVVLTNVGLDHCEQLGTTCEAIAEEKLAVVRPGATVVLGEPQWEGLARAQGASQVLHARGNLGCAVAAVSALLGREVDPAAAEGVAPPGRLECREGDLPELWDGAHNPEGVRYLLAHLPRKRYVLVASIMADKEAGQMLRLFSRVAVRLVATRSSNPRALPAEELAARAESLFGQVEVVPDPAAALERARALVREGDGEAVLVSGSLYLLSDLAREGAPVAGAKTEATER